MKMSSYPIGLVLLLSISAVKGDYQYEYPERTSNQLATTGPKWRSTSRLIKDVLGDELVDRQFFGIPLALLLAIASVSSKIILASYSCLCT